jgi:gliding motility-associated-like protein
MNNEKDILKDLFSEKLGNYEANVNPKLWNSIASKIGTTAATTSVVGTTLLSKIIIGSSITAATLVGGYVLYSSKPIKEQHVEILKPKEAQSKSVEPLESLINKNEEVEQTKRTKVVVLKTEKQIQLPPSIVSTYVDPIQIEQKVQINTEKSNIQSKEDLEKKVIESKVTPTLNPNPETVLRTLNDVVELEETTIEKLPNVFTPNNDGSNDEFSIISSGIKDFSIVVMDLQNNVVFKSNESYFKWNGLDLKGEQVPEGNYIYYVTGYNSKGKLITKYSSLKVVR